MVKLYNFLKLTSKLCLEKKNVICRGVHTIMFLSLVCKIIKYSLVSNSLFCFLQGVLFYRIHV